MNNDLHRRQDSSAITTSQTIGPFSHEAWQWAVDLGSTAGTTAALTVVGIIYDGDGAPVTDAQIEAWQPAAAEAEARHAIPGFRRVPSNDNGGFELRLPVCAQPAGEPLAYVTVFARGLVKHQFTALFLEDQAALATSAILEQVPAARRATLLALKTGAGQYRWDIHLQGKRETVFFDYA
jgi:protocatechuate 3,4-dioxygenase alpha subunit